MALRNLVVTILGLLWAAVLVLVGGRFLALLFDANRDSKIVQRLLRHSDFHRARRVPARRPSGDRDRQSDLPVEQ